MGVLETESMERLEVLDVAVVKKIMVKRNQEWRKKPSGEVEFEDIANIGVVMSPMEVSSTMMKFIVCW